MEKIPPKEFLIKEHAVHAQMIYNSSIWQQLPHILVYPLKGHALGILIVFSLILWVVTANIFGFPALIIVGSWSLKYTYHILERTMLGDSVPPMFDFNMWNVTNQRPLLQIFYFLIIFIVFSFLKQHLGIIIATIFLISGIFFIPASAVMISLENSLFSAINPFKLIILAKKIGRDYFIIVFLFGCIIGIPMLGINSLTSIVLTFYLFMMTFHLLGFLVFHSRDALGIDAHFSPEKEQAEQEKEHDRQFEKLLDDLYWLHRREDRRKEAVGLLFQRLPELGVGDDITIYHQLFVRLMDWEDKIVALALGKFYLSLLIKKQQIAVAFEIYQTCFEASENFKLGTPSEFFPLAQKAYQQKKYPIALDLVQKFLERHPNHPDVIATKFLKIQLLAEHFNQLNAAKLIMKQLLEYRKHLLYPEIKRYALFLTKL